MMPLVMARGGTGAVLLTLSAVAFGITRRHAPLPPRAVPAPVVHRSESRPVPRYRARDVAARNPFRKDRRAALVRYGEPARIEAPVSPAHRAPSFMLRGVVMGPEPAAIIATEPNLETARLVIVGEKIGALRLTRVFRDSVVLTGSDTSIVLRLDPRS